MLRKVKANYNSENKTQAIKSFPTYNTTTYQPKSRHIGKRRRQQILLGENKNPNKQILNRALVSSVKFDAMVKKREKKKVPEDDPELFKAPSGNTTSSTSTTYTICNKVKRREYQGNKVYKKQKGRETQNSEYKQALKSQRTGKWRYFRLYAENDLPCFNDISLQVIDNDVDDDCDTDDEIMENGKNYNRKKLLEALAEIFQKPAEKK